MNLGFVLPVCAIFFIFMVGADLMPRRALGFRSVAGLVRVRDVALMGAGLAALALVVIFLFRR
jgi:heme/copper-type cytochrome/quinol oxidase subunit 1